MAKMSQKELLEEGFSDKIRGIAKAAAAGVKQAARQGARLDTGDLAKGMHGAYKGEQPIAVLKATLAKEKDIEIVKIDKSNIKKQQASGKKGYLGRIVGPKSITLIPFEGVLLGKSKKPDARQYEGPSAGPSIAEAFAPEDAEVTDAPRDEQGAIKAVHEDGAVIKQINKLLLKHGVEESAAATFSPYAGHIRTKILPLIQKTHPQIKFTFNPKPELGGFDVEKAEADIAEVKPDDYRVKTESLSLRDVLRLSRFIILEKETRAELAKLLGFESRAAMQTAFKDAGGQRKWMEQNPEAIKAAERKRGSAASADEAERRFRERNPEEAEPEEPVAEEAPRGVDEWIGYIKEGGPENLKARIEEVKKSGMSTKEIGAVIDGVPKPAIDEPTYPGHEKLLASLDDKVVLDLLKLKQKIQPGLQIEFEGEQKEDEDPGEKEPGESFQGEEGMFVAELFRTKEGLTVGDIYRQGDPTDVVWSGQSGSSKGKEKGEEEKEKGKVSPVDVAVAELTAENRPITLTELISRMQVVVKGKKKGLTQDSIDLKLLKPDAILKKAGLTDAATKLGSEELARVKKAMIDLQIITERTSQKILLRQLTLLSR